MQFSTLNESSLHKTLKTYYTELYNGQTEVSSDTGYIYDIVTENGNIIEIQTKNISSLLPKIKDIISKGKNVKIVHPIAQTKIIETYNVDGVLISRRKSPIKGSVYDLLKEITGLAEFLPDSHISIDVILAELTEIRTKTDDFVQSKNNRRRFKKQWNKSNKKLSQIIETRSFCSPQDYLSLLPDNLPEFFCAKDLAELLKKQNYSERTCKNSGLIIWVLFHMKLLEYVKTDKRSRFYKITG